MKKFQLSLANWCFRTKLSLRSLCFAAKKFGAYLDLVPYKDWDAVKKAGVKMSCVLPEMKISKQTDDGLKDVDPFERSFNWFDCRAQVYEALNEALDRAYAEGIKYVIVFTGMETAADRDDQFEQIVRGFTHNLFMANESLVKKAERLGITFIIEMLNTKGDPACWQGHPRYLGHDTRELVEKVVKKIDSPSFRLAFDLYHCAMMGEDILALIEDLHEFIAYVHIAGCMPAKDGGYLSTNRGEPTLNGQSINFPAIGAALAKHLPDGTFVLAEWLLTKSDGETIRDDIGRGFNHFISDIPMV